MSHHPAELSSAVRAACAELAGMGTTVTFTAVAERTGLSRTTLYRRHDLRELIEQHQGPTGETATLNRLATQIDQLRQSLDAVAVSVRRHEEHLRALSKTGRAS